MVHDPEVGAIVVGSPTPFHAEQIMEAAKLGKHIFCEKVRLIYSVELFRRRCCCCCCCCCGSSPKTLLRSPNQWGC